jgi:hypothetical protein
LRRLAGPTRSRMLSRCSRARSISRPISRKSSFASSAERALTCLLALCVIWSLARVVSACQVNNREKDLPSETTALIPIHLAGASLPIVRIKGLVGIPTQPVLKAAVPFGYLTLSTCPRGQAVPSGVRPVSASFRAREDFILTGFVGVGVAKQYPRTVLEPLQSERPAGKALPMI